MTRASRGPLANQKLALASTSCILCMLYILYIWQRARGGRYGGECRSDHGRWAGGTALSVRKSSWPRVRETE